MNEHRGRLFGRVIDSDLWPRDWRQQRENTKAKKRAERTPQRAAPIYPRRLRSMEEDD